ncbi:MAG: ATP phosphoribosyltransferase regulatory subunit [Alphaproteobacteria bacterium]|nr:ATP phosphoribosyltransferase regulatory subunit [Alphaproteobacteria bacterium]
MNLHGKNPSLLPSGFVDLLAPEADAEAQAISILIDVFKGFGYSRVKPPLLEFEESLLTGPGAALATSTFRLMDPVSHRMMGVRPDVTPQIARIASSRLGKEKRPLRLCYANDVLRTKAGQQRTERQFCQVGCEVIGEKNIEADIEACVLALIGLDALGIQNITIDLAWPTLAGQAIGASRISGAEREKILRALERRSPDGLKCSDKKLTQFLQALIGASGPAEKALKKLSSVRYPHPGPLPKGRGGAVEVLQEICKGLNRAVKELNLHVSVTLDPAESRGLDYKTGFGFTLFAKGVAGALGRGGRYNVQKETAAGFTLYMDTVRKAMPPVKEKKTAAASYAEDWSTIRARQKKGEIVIRGKKK